MSRGALIEVLPGVQVYPNVEIGENVTLDPPLVLGKPPRGKEPGELRLMIGANSVIRPFTTIYAGTVLGAGVQTGQCVSIREDNEIADGASVGTGAILEFGNRIGARSRIHSGCFLEMTIVEEDVFVGPRVVFTDDPHPMGCPRYQECLGGVTVRALARIGANCTLLPGVVVGRNSLVGAGSVVTRHVPDDMVVAGNPARLIKAVADLTCTAGFFKRPYEWAPYAKGGAAKEKS
ncbi:MAG TPA: acyltransferase [Candidatus Eisenbacteria bacterium]|nr:acyltransferase [Candidatus Eisenbacteria bacterium]